MQKLSLLLITFYATHTAHAMDSRPKNWKGVLIPALLATQIGYAAGLVDQVQCPTLAEQLARGGRHSIVLLAELREMAGFIAGLTRAGDNTGLGEHQGSLLNHAAAVEHALFCDNAQLYNATALGQQALIAAGDVIENEGL